MFYSGEVVMRKLYQIIDLEHEEGRGDFLRERLKQTTAELRNKRVTRRQTDFRPET
jgi:hypothetical protein